MTLIPTPKCDHVFIIAVEERPLLAPSPDCEPVIIYIHVRKCVMCGAIKEGDE